MSRDSSTKQRDKPQYEGEEKAPVRLREGFNHSLPSITAKTKENQKMKNI